MKISSSTINGVFDKIGTTFSSPQQRVFQGVVALGIQPFIDFRNKGTDDETRAVSTARTIGKIIAGTVTGFAVRHFAIKGIENYSQFKINGENMCIADKLSEDTLKKTIDSFAKADKKSIFTPRLQESVKGMKIGEFMRRYKNYTKVGGTLLGLGAMVFTNFLIDVPITKALTKKLTPVFRNKLEKETNKSERQVLNAKV